ncbi:hypothetical protein EDB85DRAFT_1887790 [Lactarius pseudohatsudake]|nr:hypothetical protein EDB85DRAFT_1887790 [Lactarius pseudohatsudake]
MAPQIFYWDQSLSEKENSLVGRQTIAIAWDRVIERAAPGPRVNGVAVVVALMDGTLSTLTTPSRGREGREDDPQSATLGPPGPKEKVSLERKSSYTDVEQPARAQIAPVIINAACRALLPPSALTPAVRAPLRLGFRTWCSPRAPEGRRPAQLVPSTLHGVAQSDMSTFDDSRWPAVTSCRAASWAT